MIPFTLTMLGTDTVYTHTLKTKAKDFSKKKGDTVVDYPKGELLSVISSQIGQLAPKKDVEGVHRADKIAVIDGPNTRGTNVHTKIGQGLAEVLLAVARGQNPINIIAHSRGAVESILIAHELQAIQNMIQNQKSFSEVIAELKKQAKARKENTGDITADLEKYLASFAESRGESGWSEDWFASLQKNLPHTVVNFFGIDPVPGNIFPITWDDPRYFTLPPIVKNAEIIYYENERSWLGFDAACVRAEDPGKTNLQRLSMPGHHGTASAGNNASQKKQIMSEQKTTQVQKLMLFKLLDFLNKQGVSITDMDKSFFGEKRALGRKYAKRIKEDGAYDTANLDFPSIYLMLYREIFKNKAGYDAYNGTGYTGVTGYSSRTLIAADKNGAHAMMLFNEFITLVLGFVNAEHQELLKKQFERILGLKAGADVSVLAMLGNCLEHLKRPIDLNVPIGTDLSLSMTQTVADLFQPEQGQMRDDFVKTFASLLPSACEQYLNLNTDISKYKLSLLKVIKDYSDLFNEWFAQEGVKNRFAKQLNANIVLEIYTGLEGKYRALDAKISQFKHPKLLNEKLKEFFLGLLDSERNEQINRLLHEIIERCCADNLHASSDLILRIQQELRNELLTFPEQNLSEQLDARIEQVYQDAEIKDGSSDASTKLIAIYEKHEKQYEQSYESLNAFALLHQQLQSLIFDLQILNKQVIFQITDGIIQTTNTAHKALSLLHEQKFVELRQLLDLFRKDILDGLQVLSVEEYEKIKTLLEKIGNPATVFNDAFKKETKKTEVLKPLEALKTVQDQYSKIDPSTAVFQKYLPLLYQKSAELVEQAALKFYKDRLPEEHPLPEPLGSFGALVEAYAIQHHGVIDRSQQKLADLEAAKTQVKTEAEKLRSELDTTKTQIKAAVDKLSRELETAKLQAKAAEEQLSRELATAKTQAKTEAEQLRSALDTTKTQAKAEADQLRSALDTTKIEAKTEADQLRSALDTTKIEAKIEVDQLRSALDTTKVEAKIEVDQLRSELDTTKIQAQAAVDKLSRELATAKLQATAAVDKLSRELATAKLQANATVDKLNRELETAKTQAKAAVDQLSSELATAKTAADQLRSVLDTAKTQAKTEADQLRSALDTAKTQAKTEADQLRRELGATKTQAKAEIDKLKSELETAKAEADKLSGELKTAKTQAKTEVDKSGQRFDAEIKEKRVLHAALNDQQEAQYLLLIEQKLKPLTKNYLTQLNQSTNGNNTGLKNIKIAHLQNLLRIMDDSMLTPKPSVRARKFYVELNRVAEAFQAHRDPAWRRYVQNAIIFAGILVSGIIPGLIALNAYVNKGNTSAKSSFFWRSAGANVVEKLNEASLCVR